MQEFLMQSSINRTPNLFGQFSHPSAMPVSRALQLFIIVCFFVHLFFSIMFLLHEWHMSKESAVVDPTESPERAIRCSTK